MTYMHERTQAHIRATALRFLTEVCDITSETHASGTSGEDTITETTIGSNVPCRLISAGSSNTSAGDIMAAREVLTDLYELVLPQEQALDVDYTVTHNGNVYSVVRLNTEWTDKPFRKAIITRKR